jgi:hypothetical protein
MELLEVVDDEQYVSPSKEVTVLRHRVEDSVDSLE